MNAPTVRIASLVPSLTELVVSLGLADYLVARTGYCIHPAEVVARIPKVGGTKTVNLAKLRRLAPTHVLVNVDENRRELVDELAGWGADAPELIVTHPTTPEDNVALVAQLAGAFDAVPGLRARAEALSIALAEELERTRPPADATQRVLYLIWCDPWMTVARDTYVSAMLARVGWATLPARHGGSHGAGRYPTLTGDEDWLAAVDRVLLSSEPFAFGPEHAARAAALCPNALVQHVDGELLSWYGPRAVAGLRYLRDLAGAAAGNP
ncbi:helical backbone metal receptor [Piscinibacter koreensis]|uniref:Cobalamin-binding protein n=1 Tax=Piscinibacter koreensis TaxID=2742824 RepID=A0A7Y6NJM4_9BURK|nr:helical backbone metal receptor [Schlegelella koreensis]NUZ04408.1 cobalamin-binding protein [Schlegelella koreensis]